MRRSCSNVAVATTGPDGLQSMLGLLASSIVVRNVQTVPALGLRFYGGDHEGFVLAATWSNHSYERSYDSPYSFVRTARMAIFTKKGAMFDTTGKVLYGSVPTNNVFRGFTGTCEARNNGDAVVRYDQLADRWLIVMPIFSRSTQRTDQPTARTPRDPAQVSVVGVAGQPGRAAPLYQPPPPPPDTAPPGPAGQRGRGGR